MQVITADMPRLDPERGRTLLEQTVAALQPRLLIVNPFVRRHQVDENSSRRGRTATGGPAETSTPVRSLRAPRASLGDCCHFRLTGAQNSGLYRYPDLRLKIDHASIEPGDINDQSAHHGCADSSFQSRAAGLLKVTAMHDRLGSPRKYWPGLYQASVPS